MQRQQDVAEPGLHIHRQCLQMLETCKSVRQQTRQAFATGQARCR